MIPVFLRIYIGKKTRRVDPNVIMVIMFYLFKLSYFSNISHCMFVIL